MDYKKTAEEIFLSVGGRENLVSAAHCATRLRLVIADNKKCDSKAVENIDGVKGVFFASGQLQIILGTGVVNKVYEQFLLVSGTSESSKEEVKQQAAAKANPFQRAIKTLGDIFVPIIPAIVASGFLMGIMEALNFMVTKGFLELDTTGSIYVFAKLFSNTAYVFLPILIAFSAAKVFGGNPFLGAVIGMIMIHPDLQNAWTVATEGVQIVQPVFGGLYAVDLIGYQGHVIPVMIAVYVMCFIEKRLHKVVPASLDLFVTPLVSVFITGYLTLAAIGPVFVLIENNILGAVQWLISIPYGIGSFLMGGLYATTVVSGIHHMYTIIDMGQLSLYGLTFWLPLASAANVAQGGAALAVALRTKDKKLRAMALPSSLSAFMGITEPAIFGVNLRFIRPFIAGSIGGACGALYASIVHLGATGTGVTGIFGILLHLSHPVQYLITMAISLGVSFGLSWVMGTGEKQKEEKEAAQKTEDQQKETEMAEKRMMEKGKNAEAAAKNDTEKERAETAAEEHVGEKSAEKAARKELVIGSPASGKVIPLSKVNDPTFSSGIMGVGCAVIPEKGEILAPFDGVVAVMMDSKHAVCLESKDGIELLIHIGLDTVQLGGRFYEAHVKSGDPVKAGDLLLTFDVDAIAAEGYNTVTPVIVTNPDAFAGCEMHAEGKVCQMERLITVTPLSKEECK